MIDPVKLEHLTEQQRRELLAILDEFADCFSETVTLLNMRFMSRRILSLRDSELIKFRNV